MTPTPEPADGLVVGQEVLLYHRPYVLRYPETCRRVKIERLTSASVFADGQRFDRKPRWGFGLREHGSSSSRCSDTLELIIDPAKWPNVEAECAASKAKHDLKNRRRSLVDPVGHWLIDHATHADLDALQAMMAKGKEEGK